MQIPTHARCSKCRQEKPAPEFSRHRFNKNGLQAYCKTCSNASVRRYGRSSGYSYTWPTEKKRAANRAYRERFPEKQRAVAAINDRLYRGTLTRQPCEVCGAEKTHAHHDDYSKPLDVRWLCPKHHMELHAKLRSAA